VKSLSVIPRALRKWLAANPTGKPADKVIFLGKPWRELSPGQLAMTKGLVTVWKEVVGELSPAASNWSLTPSPWFSRMKSASFGG
jgi:hypothetical protein